jgi:hypothetical protein
MHWRGWNNLAQIVVPVVTSNFFDDDDEDDADDEDPAVDFDKPDEANLRTFTIGVMNSWINCFFSSKAGQK